MRVVAVGGAVVSALLCVSCLSSVRPNYFPEREVKERRAEDVRPPLIASTRSADNKKRDTVVIDYTTPLRSQSGQVATPRESLPAMPSMSLVESYEDALSQFDNGEYANACERFRAIAETLSPDDSLAYEARFMEAECAIANNNMLSALSTLIGLSLDTQTPDAVLEKVLVRKGQTQCLLGEYESARHSFEQFRKRFPNSLYVPLANCEAAQ